MKKQRDDRDNAPVQDGSGGEVPAFDGSLQDGGLWVRRILPYIVLAVACIFFCWFFVMRHGVFGSRIDWANQHSVLPDYFRKRFYETGNLLPDFAWNLGGGQNVYHLSYYGLFSPVILFSFLLPFLRMDLYIMGSSIFCYTVSVLLFYFFLKKKKMPQGICFGAALFFSLASPLTYHFYNQLMFVNYMPFLCLAVIGTDDYLERQRRGWLLAGVTGMILTSFYFSIGGLAALCLYAVSEYLRGTESVTFLPLFRKGCGYVGNLLHGIILSGILLVPTAISVFSSRQENTLTEQVMEIISFAPLKILYTPYGMGLSVFAIVALLGGILCLSGWRERVLPVGLVMVFAVPAVGFLLNGGLYEKGKVFIPFLPFVCLQCARYVEQCIPLSVRKIVPKEQEAYQGILSRCRNSIVFQVLKQFLPWLVMYLLLHSVRDLPELKNYQETMWIDFGMVFLCFLVSAFLFPALRNILGRRGISGSQKLLRFMGAFSVPLVFVSSCLSLFIYDMEMNKEKERMFTYEEYQEVTDSGRESALKEILKEDTSFYRMEVSGDGTADHNNMNRLADIRQYITSMYSSCYNREYWNFRKNTFALNEPFRNIMMQSVTDNPCFLTLMGVKYLMADGQPAGYQQTKKPKVYKNSSVAPILYVTDQVISEKSYKKLAFPANQTVLLRKAVVGEASSENDTADLPQMSECGFKLEKCDSPELTIKKISGGYKIKAKEETEVQAKLLLNKKSEKHNLIALVFDVENNRAGKDMHIRINGQTNRLTSIYHEYANQNTNFTFLTTKAATDQTVSMQFGEGSYRICGIRAFTGSLDTLQDSLLYQSPVEVDTLQTLDSQLSGSVKVAKDGYLVTSIPYDENFTIKLDGNEIEGNRVNTAFLGAKIPAGKHEITLSYRAPGKMAGGILSLAGIMVLMGAVLRKRGQMQKSVI